MVSKQFKKFHNDCTKTFLKRFSNDGTKKVH